MKTQNEIEAKIKELEESYSHVLKGDFAVIDINAPRALMQLDATSKIGTLYWCLGKSRPVYEFEKNKK